MSCSALIEFPNWSAAYLDYEIKDNKGSELVARFSMIEPLYLRKNSRV